jgi:DNA-binding CsgD family transcriptional regulator
VLRTDLTIESVTAQAWHWLDQFPADRGTGLELPAAVYAVARRVLANLTDPVADPPAGARVRLTTGRWLVVDAAPLRDPAAGAASADGERIAVMLVPAGPAEIVPLHLELHGLTDRESEIAVLLVRGLSMEEIAQQLWVSRHTVKDHVKSIYNKIDVTNRPELTAKLFHEHHLPACAAPVRNTTPA